MQKKTDTQILNADIAILPISSIAAALNVHQRTLRIYDKEGILTPRRTDKNRRNYSLNDLERAKLVLFLTRNLALNLAGVKIILKMLEEQKIEPKSYLEYINKIAKMAGVDTSMQEINIEKTSRRGRRTKES